MQTANTPEQQCTTKNDLCISIFVLMVQLHMMTVQHVFYEAFIVVFVWFFLKKYSNRTMWLTYAPDDVDYMEQANTNSPRTARSQLRLHRENSNISNKR